jgi:hypothetical protein
MCRPPDEASGADQIADLHDTDAAMSHLERRELRLQSRDHKRLIRRFCNSTAEYMDVSQGTFGAAVTAKYTVRTHNAHADALTTSQAFALSGGLRPTHWTSALVVRMQDCS